MPSVSPDQHRFMGMSASKEGRAWLEKHGKKPAPRSVAQEFLAADRAKKPASALLKR